MKKNMQKNKIKQLLRRWDNGEIDLAAEILDDTPASVGEQARFGREESDFFSSPLKYKSDFRPFRRTYPILAILLGLSIILTLVFTVSHLPAFGSPASPANNEVSQKYLEDGVEDTGATNIVAAMILDYRAYDTLGESHVLFAALTAVLILLLDHTGLASRDNQREDKLFNLSQDIILRVIIKILVPAIMLFGIYVILNGHISPGGGFSGGAIIGAGFMLYSMAFGFEKIQRFLNQKTFSITIVCALAFYGLAKGYSFFMGAHHLETGIPLGIPGNILSAGLILPLNIAVGLVVACTMYGIYSLFQRGRI